MKRRDWRWWLGGIMWLIGTAYAFPHVVRRLADPYDPIDGGFIQGDGFVHIVIRLVQATFEAAVLGACYGFMALWIGGAVVYIVAGCFERLNSIVSSRRNRAPAPAAPALPPGYEIEKPAAPAKP